MTSACHAATGAAPAEAGASVLLVGNPNVGKSTLFNLLTGSRQTVMNAPGTTVELTAGTWRGPDLPLVDLPGTYSLVARTPDEAVVRETLDARPEAVAVVVLDAAALSRSLYLLAQVGATRPVVAAVTMLDVAHARGLGVDVGALRAALGVPVVAVDPRAGTGLDELAAAVGDAAPLVGVPRCAGPCAGPCAAIDGGAADGTCAGCEACAGCPGCAPLATADRLFGWVDDVVGCVAAPAVASRTVSDRVDGALLSPWVGGPVLLAVMWALFELTTRVAAPVMDLVDAGVSAVAGAARGWLDGAPAWVTTVVVDGALVGAGTVLTFLPLLAIIYVALALLEDSGYLARAAVLADRLMRVMGLDGRAMLPLVIGFGCNVPAIAATQTLPHARQRLLTGMLVPWASCAARLPVYVLLAGAFFPEHAGTAVMGMYLLSLVLIVGGGLVLRRTLFRDVRTEPLLLVLPAYQRPRLGAIVRSVALRVQAFATRAGGVIVGTLVVVAVLMAVPAGGFGGATGGAGGVAGGGAGGGGAVGGGAGVAVEDSLYGAVARAAAPVLAPAGFDDWRFAASLVTGFVAKEVTVGALAQSYSVAEDDAADLRGHLRATLDRTSGGHGAAAGLAFMVFVLGYSPCLATAAEMWRRFGRRWTAATIGIQLATAWLLAVGVFQVGVVVGGAL